MSRRGVGYFVTETLPACEERQALWENESLDMTFYCQRYYERSRGGLRRSGPRGVGRIGLGIVITIVLEGGTAAAALIDGKSQSAMVPSL